MRTLIQLHSNAGRLAARSLPTLIQDPSVSPERGGRAGGSKKLLEEKENMRRWREEECRDRWGEGKCYEKKVGKQGEGEWGHTSNLAEYKQDLNCVREGELEGGQKG